MTAKIHMHILSVITGVSTCRFYSKVLRRSNVIALTQGLIEALYVRILSSSDMRKAIGEQTEENSIAVADRV